MPAFLHFICPNAPFAPDFANQGHEAVQERPTA